MARLTKTQAKIFNAHKEAYQQQSWTMGEVKDFAEFVEGIKAGKTSEELWDQIEIHKVSITSLVMASMYKHVSGAMEKAMRQGFAEWLTSVGIV